MRKKIFFLIGPTSSGKTAIGVQLARKIDREGLQKAEIVCCDSRQVYIDLNIGSGKATEEEMAGIPHHMLSVVKLGEYFSVTDYVELALKKIREIESKGNIPIVSGGTGLYIDAILYEYSLPDVLNNPELRDNMSLKSLEELWTILRSLDPNFVDKIKDSNKQKELKNNRNRMIRYIEIASELGFIPELKKTKRFKEDKYDTEIIKTNVDRKILHQRIHTRTIQRLKAGMLEEFIMIIKKYNLSEKYIRAMGYEFRLIWALINKQIDEKTFLEEFVKQEYQYARRQDTWFRRY